MVGLRKKEKTIKLAKIRRHIREAIQWQRVDNGMPRFYTSEDYKRSRIVKKPSIGHYPYYTKSDRAIKEIAEKIYELIVKER